MQTKITFTVGLEDVVDYIRYHLESEFGVVKNTTISELDHAIQAVVQYQHNLGDLRYALIYLDNFRKRLAKHDTRILECMRVLEGYINSAQEELSTIEGLEPPNLEDLEKDLEKFEVKSE